VETTNFFAIFGVLTTVLLNITGFWVVTPCQLIKLQAFRGTLVFPSSGSQTAWPAWTWRWTHYEPSKCT